MVTFFAIVIPLLKIGLLILGELWRQSSDPRRVKIARRSIVFVQLISKWACPDMIAYILLQYLVKTLDHPSQDPTKPGTLNGLFELDAGFTCYTLFCLGSTISSLGVVLPGTDYPTPKAAKATKVESRVLGLSLSMLTAAFAACLGVGLSYSCMSLRLDFQPLIDNGRISKEMVPILIDKYHLQDLAHADVTIPRCIGKVVNEITNTFEFNGILAVVMMALFVIGFAVLGMVVILLTAVQFNLGDERWRPTLRLAKKLKKIAMLDVTILGICVVVASGTVYKSEGLILSIQPGILGLIGAQVSYEITYWLVTWWCTRRGQQVPPQIVIKDFDAEKASRNAEVVQSVVPETAENAATAECDLEKAPEKGAGISPSGTMPEAEYTVSCTTHL